MSDFFEDLASRPVDLLENLSELSADQLNHHPAGHPNSIAWLLWHIGRGPDAQLANLRDEEELWSAEGFRDQFSLGRIGDSVGFGQTAEEAAAITVDEFEPLKKYGLAVLTALKDYASSRSAEQLAEIVDENWEPPVTRASRLISIIMDATQHLAQIYYILGMTEK